jgi:hypothetical protein
MRIITSLCLYLLLAVSTGQTAPIKLHPTNPHYFEWRGKPTILITSAEHYGAVLNHDFNYYLYLRTLEKDGLNLTRVFSGAYCEPAGAFNITSNTLAPLRGKLLTPWARSDTPGYANGGNKFDLNQWDPLYFLRLKDFIREADKRGVVVEFTLFCPFYKDDMWALSPMNAANNINGISSVNRTNVYTLDKHEGLLAVQETMVRKLVAELKDCDNLMWEICNEPYFGGVTLEWQHHIADVIVDAEKNFKRKHLITQNIANGKKKIENPHPAVSVFNFHYATPPETVGLNYGLNKVIGDNETGFKKNADDHYRMEGWEFILAGGALYNNLDYSFVAGHEDGTFAYPDKTPGGGNPGFRKQISVLREFMHSFDFVRMHPDKSFIKSALPKGARVQALMEPGKQYALYLKGDGFGSIELDLPKDSYKLKWIDVHTGDELLAEDIEYADGKLFLVIPVGAEEVALSIKGR